MLVLRFVLNYRDNRIACVSYFTDGQIRGSRPAPRSSGSYACTWCSPTSRTHLCLAPETGNYFRNDWFRAYVHPLERIGLFRRCQCPILAQCLSMRF